MTGARPLAGVSWALHPALRDGMAQALADGRVEVVEWTVDVGWGRVLPPSTSAVLDAFEAAGRLFGHGVGLSPLSAGRRDLRDRWLDRLRADPRRYQHLSEHFGWSIAGSTGFGAPLPMPRTADTLRVGRDNLRRLADAAGVPVGLENLALVFSAADALDQGLFVAELLEPVDGFVHLDLHNLWCQVVNFDLDPERLLARWPLERVRVVHVSGGSWAGGVRRDTHDDRVPEPVWDLLRAVLPRLPVCEGVLLEQLPGSFDRPGAAAGFVADFERLRREVCGDG